jgi:hypothetical protein
MSGSASFQSARKSSEAALPRARLPQIMGKAQECQPVTRTCHELAKLPRGWIALWANSVVISLGTALLAPLAPLACSLRRGQRKRRICEAEVQVGSSG